MSDDCAETRDMDTVAQPACESAFAKRDVSQEQSTETLPGLLARLTARFAAGTPTHEEAPKMMVTDAPCSEHERLILAAIRRRRRYDGITAADLAAQAGVTERTARAIVAHLIVEHEAPICGTPMESYYWPERYEDVASTLASLQSRRRELEARIDGLRRGASRLYGTIPMFE